MNEKLQIEFETGTLLLTGWSDARMQQLTHARFDSRTKQWRMEAKLYRQLIENLRESKQPYEDKARTYQPCDFVSRSTRQPFPHQIEAVETWDKAGKRGVVVLPTGTGKSFVAILAIERTKRPTLVVVPTIDLMNQWYSQLKETFGIEIGMIGGGYHELQSITVTTYQSAYDHVERYGNRFGLLIFDECHHLPGPTFSLAAIGSIAPFRLGLSATPERGDGMEALYPELIGPIIYRREIRELSGDFLAEYRTERIFVPLTLEEREQYLNAKQIYRDFIQSRNIQISGRQGWQRFIFESTKSQAGKDAFQAYRTWKAIERTASNKFNILERLLLRHANERLIIFTADNATVYRIARQFLVPAITHQTKAKERKQILERVHSGDYNVVVTSQVLNEGVDVPAASVGVILSGSSTIRENVQRLGRILRKQPDKQAILYEIIAQDTSEEYSSERRRQHGAFQ